MSSMSTLIAVGSSAVVLLLILAVFLVIGCICCCCKQRQKHTLHDHESTDKTTNSQDNVNIAPIYEDLIQETMKCQDTDIDFKENVAYSTVTVKNKKI